MILQLQQAILYEKTSTATIGARDTISTGNSTIEGAKGLENFSRRSSRRQIQRQEAQMSRSMEILKRADGDRQNMADNTYKFYCTTFYF